MRGWGGGEDGDAEGGMRKRRRVGETTKSIFVRLAGEDSIYVHFCGSCFVKWWIERNRSMILVIFVPM